MPSGVYRIPPPQPQAPAPHGAILEVVATGTQFPQTITATALVTTATLGKQPGKVISASVVTTATFRRDLAKSVTASVLSLTESVVKSIAKTLGSDSGFFAPIKTTRWLSKPPAGIQANRAHPLCPTVAYLLNEGAGGRIVELLDGVQSFDFIGATGVPAWIGGSSGSALRLVRANSQYVRLAGRRLLARAGNPCTYSVRFRTTTTVATQTLCGETITANSTPCFLLRFNTAATGSVSAFYRSDASQSIVVTYNAGAHDGEWHTLTVVYAEKAITLYLDSVQVATGSNASINTFTPTAAAIGARHLNAPLEYFDGDIEFCYGWNRALTAAEVASHVAQPYAFMRPTPAFGGVIPTPNVTTTATLSALRAFLKTLSATLTTTTTFVRSMGKTLSAALVLTAQLLKGLTRTLSASLSQTASIVKSVGKSLAANVAVIGAMEASRAILKTLSASLTLTATLAAPKTILRSLSASLTAAATMTRSAIKSLSASLSETASLIKSAGKSLSASLSKIATIATIKAAVKVMTADVTDITVGLSKQCQKTFTVPLTLSASFVRSVGKRLSVSLTEAASFVFGAAIQRTLTAGVSTAASMSRGLGKTLSVVLNLTASVRKSIPQTLTAGVVSVLASMEATRAFLFTMTTATITTAASMSRSIGKSVSALLTPVVSVLKSAAHTLTASFAFTASQTRIVGKNLLAILTTSAAFTAFKSFGVFLSTTIGISESMTRRALKTLTAHPSTLVTIRRGMTSTLTAIISVSGVLTKTFGKVLSAGVVTSASLLHSAGLTLVLAITTLLGLGDPVKVRARKDKVEVGSGKGRIDKGGGEA